ncbi:MAG: T9SS type A sorting domain-containing protein [Chlorobi bacterium]|nr:T9SS type A sorting domain-containing protein [Chlorobiota bacterium]
MKKTALFLLLFTTSISYSQDYKLFNSNSKKLFATHPDMLSTYSLSFDSANGNNNDSTYYNFFRIDTLNFESPECDFWIGPECYKQNIPVWIGAKIDFDNLNSYSFYPNNGDTIHFEFNPNTQDTIDFYEDEEQIFSIYFEGADTLTVLGYPDSARFFKILHTDIDGNEINSTINGKEIITTKILGLTQFFQIDSFPQTLRPIYLVGHNIPELGMTKITNEILYDYQVGDEIQYKYYHYTTYGPPWENFTKYTKHTILSKTETQDSIIYLIDEFSFYLDSSQAYSNIVTKKYLRHGIVAHIPFELFNGFYHNLQLGDFCGIKLWQYYSEENSWLEYCDIDNVWGYFDTDGPPGEWESVQVCGLGTYHSYGKSYNGAMWNSSTSIKDIIFFKKDGISCGNEVIFVGTKENKEADIHISIYPNPCKNTVNFKSNAKQITSAIKFELRDLQGGMVKETLISEIEEQLDISGLPQGIYFYLLLSENKIIQNGKLIVQ